MSSEYEMMSSVAYTTDVAAVNVEYPEDDGSKCAASTGVIPASGCICSADSAGGGSRTEAPFRQRPGCELRFTPRNKPSVGRLRDVCGTTSFVHIGNTEVRALLNKTCHAIIARVMDSVLACPH